MPNPKVMLILFDGAEWNIIHPLLREGRLPNLASFMRQGTYGQLRALDDVALASPILWTSIATGKLPQKHGVKDFFATAASVQSARLWEIFEHDGLPIGLFRYLITWPPRPTRGFIVPDWCARTPEAFPEELSFINTMKETGNVSQLIRNAVMAVRHGMRLPTLSGSAWEVLRERLLRPPALETLYRKRFAELAVHTDIFLGLRRRYNPYFAVFYTGLPDALQHQYWQFIEPGKFRDISAPDVERYKHVIPAAYEHADRSLGRLLDGLDPETLVVIASDHGGEANEEDYCWANIREDAFLKALGLQDAVNTFRIGPRNYFHARPGSALAGSIKHLERLLKGVTLDDSATPVFEVEITSDDELFIQVAYLKDTFDQLMQNACLRFEDGRKFPVHEMFNLSHTISGNHSMQGVILMRGPGVKRNHEISGACQLDVTPTVLALLGRPVGRDMDGAVLTDAIREEFLQRRPVTYIDSYDTLLGREYTAPAEDTDIGREEVKERLKALGYIN